jgi:branched-chain amino acid transport system substrate-binding protein
MKAAVLVVMLSGILAVGCGSGETAASVETTTCSDMVYEGEGKPDAIIVSDLLRGEPSSAVRVITEVLRRGGFRAGVYRVGYQACHSDGAPGTCERNAEAYAATGTVLGVIGPFYSVCAASQIPILSRTETGPLAMVSATNTDPGLTRATRFSDHHPRLLYPSGVRNYARVVATDDDVGAAAAVLAKQMGMRRVVAIVNRESFGFTWYGPSVGGGFLEAAKRLGLVTTELEWRPQESYADTARHAATARPQLVFLAGHTQSNAKRLMEDLRRALGPKVVFAGGDQLLAAPSLPTEYGPLGEGLRVTVAGVSPKGLTRETRAFLRSLGAPEDELYLVETAQAAEVLLDAIARSDGTRASVVDELLETRITRGLLGTFSFDRYGDITPAVVSVKSIRNGRVVDDGVIPVARRPSEGDD